jgi:sulfopyruvate decarboxylase TPP-binding subunit
VSKLSEVVASGLKAADVKFGAYVADHLLSGITEELSATKGFRLQTVAREDEGMAIIGGAYLGGASGVMLMQSSGFALCANVLGSFLLPYQIPVPMLVGLRGGIGEFNVAQLHGGQSVAPICAALGVPYFEPVSLEEFADTFSGVVETCFSTGRSVCIAIRRTIAP